MAYLPSLDAAEQITQQELNEWRSIHWGIECYYRAVKQLCGISRFRVRTSQAITPHIFCSIRAFTQLKLMQTEELIGNWYKVQRNLYLQVARRFILKHITQKLF